MGYVADLEGTRVKVHPALILASSRHLALAAPVVDPRVPVSGRVAEAVVDYLLGRENALDPLDVWDRVLAHSILYGGYTLHVILDGDSYPLSRIAPRDAGISLGAKCDPAHPLEDVEVLRLWHELRRGGVIRGCSRHPVSYEYESGRRGSPVPYLGYESVPLLK